MLDSDVFDQNDAGEFLSIFLDKLETSLKYAGIAKRKHRIRTMQITIVEVMVMHLTS